MSLTFLASITIQMKSIPLPVWTAEHFWTTKMDRVHQILPACPEERRRTMRQSIWNRRETVRFLRLNPEPEMGSVELNLCRAPRIRASLHSRCQDQEAETVLTGSPPGNGPRNASRNRKRPWWNAAGCRPCLLPRATRTTKTRLWSWRILDFATSGRFAELYGQKSSGIPNWNSCIKDTSSSIIRTT